MEVIVDRIEGNFVVLELPSLEYVNVPKILIPNAVEGDIINIQIDYEKRKKKEAEVKAEMRKLFLDYKEEN